MQTAATCRMGPWRHGSLALFWSNLLLGCAIAASAMVGCGAGEEFELGKAELAVVSYPTQYVSGRSGGGWGFRSTSLTRPGLTKFNFDFARSDHHIKGIGAGHFFEGNSLRWNLAQMAYYDNSRTDDFYYYQENRQLPPGTYFCQYTGDRWSFRRVCDPGLPNDLSNYVLVLTGFFHSFGQDDHLEFISLQPCESGSFPWCGTMHGDSQLVSRWVWVSYAHVPKAYVRRSYTIRGKSSGSWGSAPIKGYHPVLQGFYFEYDHGEHHIKELGVQLHPGYPGRLDVQFADRGGGDNFHWRVQYADLIDPSSI